MEALTVTVNGACRALGVSRTKIYQLIARGELEAIKIDNRRADQDFEHPRTGEWRFPARCGGVNNTVRASKKDYATKAKFEHALRMARLAGIDEVGSIELGPDGTIRIAGPAASPAPAVEDEIAKWRERKRR